MHVFHFIATIKLCKLYLSELFSFSILGGLTHSVFGLLQYLLSKLCWRQTIITQQFIAMCCYIISTYSQGQIHNPNTAPDPPKSCTKINGGFLLSETPISYLLWIYWLAALSACTILTEGYGLYGFFLRVPHKKNQKYTTSLLLNIMCYYSTCVRRYNTL